jgi:hypothetical protein
VYSPPRPSNQLPGKSNVGFMRRYFTNLRTLKELPYFYNRTTGRGAGRAYLFLMGANPNTGFNASANLVPTQPGVELNPKEFIKNSYTLRSDEELKNFFNPETHEKFKLDIINRL